MHLSTRKLPPTLRLKSTTLPQLTEVLIKLYQILVEIKSPPWKNYLLWGVGDLWNFNFKFHPIDLYGESGRLWKALDLIYRCQFKINCHFHSQQGSGHSVMPLWINKTHRHFSIETVPDPLGKSGNFLLVTFLFSPIKYRIYIKSNILLKPFHQILFLSLMWHISKNT